MPQLRDGPSVDPDKNVEMAAVYSHESEVIRESDVPHITFSRSVGSAFSMPWNIRCLKP
jgi:hypothetical protein